MEGLAKDLACDLKEEIQYIIPFKKKEPYDEGF